MIYTSYEMVRDCRADKPEGWSYFIVNYVPVIRKLLVHYGEPGALERVLLAVRKPESSLFQSMEPAPERWFVAELRQKVLAELPEPKPGIPLDLDSVAQAFAPLTLVEKQAAWIESMGYDAAATGAMLRMAPKTVEKIRDRAAELLRATLDGWNRAILAENGRSLGKEAAARKSEECPQSKVFLDILDGRTTWRGREVMEQHVLSCWHCVDHFSRMVEVVELIRGVQPLAEAEAVHFQSLLGIKPAKRSLWHRLAARSPVRD